MDPRLVVLALGAFAGTMESATVPALLPGIGAETATTASQTGYLVFAYSLAYAIAAPVLAALLGAADRRRVVAGAELTLGLCCVLIAFAPSLPLIIAARSLLACAAVLFTSMAQATVVAIAPPGRPGRALGVVLTGGTVAAGLGAPLGALIALQFGWRVTYGVVATLALAAAVTMWLRLPAGIVGERKPLRERFAVLAIPGVPGTLLMNLVFTIGAVPVGIYLAAITTQAMGLGPQTIPLVILASGLGSVSGGYVGGAMVDRLGARRTVLLLMLVTTAQLVSVSAIPLLPAPMVLPAWMLSIGLLGFTAWAIYAGQLAMLAALAPEAVPLALSLNLSASNIGAALGAAAGSLALPVVGAGSIGIAGAVFTLAAVAILLTSRRPAV